jgi:hypothetical protein
VSPGTAKLRASWIKKKSLGMLKVELKKPLFPQLGPVARVRRAMTQRVNRFIEFSF